MTTCPGSHLVIDAPKGAENLTCPHCGRRVEAWEYDKNIWRWDGGAPRFVLKGHQEVQH